MPKQPPHMLIAACDGWKKNWPRQWCRSNRKTNNTINPVTACRNGRRSRQLLTLPFAAAAWHCHHSSTATMPQVDCCIFFLLRWHWRAATIEHLHNTTGWLLLLFFFFLMRRQRRFPLRRKVDNARWTRGVKTQPKNNRCRRWFFLLFSWRKATFKCLAQSTNPTQHYEKRRGTMKMPQLKEKRRGMMQNAAAKPLNAVDNAAARCATQSTMPRHNTCQCRGTKINLVTWRKMLQHDAQTIRTKSGKEKRCCPTLAQKTMPRNKE